MGIPERLRYARQGAGLTGVQVKERTGIGTSSLSEFESGRREPSVSQLQKLASAYRRAIAFFLAEGEIPREIVLWREKPHGVAQDLEAEFLRLCRQYRNLEIWTGDELPLRLPRGDSGAKAFTFHHAQKLAQQVRNELQLGDHPALALLSVLQEVCGVKVFHLEFEPTGTAASSKSESFGAAVLLNAGNVRWRRNFDLAHELFHLLTWDIFRAVDQDGQVSAVAGEEEESLANCFARNLLLPPEALRTAVDDGVENGRIPYEALFDIVRQFDVSIDALFWQIHRVYNWGQENADRTRGQIDKAQGWAAALDRRRSSAKPPQRPDRYWALAVRALRHGEISIGRFAEYLDVTRPEALRYAEQEITDDDEVQVAPA